MEQRDEHRFGPGKSLAFSLLLISLFLGVAELMVRGWSYYARDETERFDIATQTFVLIPGEHRSGAATVRINSQGFVGPELRSEGPDLWRIVAVGDSCTYGEGNDSNTYPAMLQRLLDERKRSGVRYEVVNAGISGLNSELALRRLRSKVLPLQADVIVLYVGWNDLMKFDPTSQTDTKGFSNAARVLDGLWLVKGLRKLIFFHLRPRMWPPATGPGSRTGVFSGFRPTRFENNLREMISDVRGSDAQPVLLTLPTVVRSEMTLQDLRDAGVFFPYFPSAYGVGDLLDLIAAYNASIRQVGEEERTPVLDVATAVAGIEDPTEYLFDTMHSRPTGMRFIAQQVLMGLERHDLLPSSESELRSR